MNASRILISLLVTWPGDSAAGCVQGAEPVPHPSRNQRRELKMTSQSSNTEHLPPASERVIIFDTMRDGEGSRCRD